MQNYVYTRGNNPTVEICEQKIARLEKGESARCFGSGMAAITSAILTFLRTGDHIVSIKNFMDRLMNFCLLSSSFNVETSLFPALLLRS